MNMLMSLENKVGKIYTLKNTHATSEVVGRHLDVAVGALMFLSSIFSVLKKRSKTK